MFGRKTNQNHQETVTAVDEQSLHPSSPGESKTKKKNKAPFLVNPRGPHYLQRVGQSLKRWWWLWFLIIASIVLLITLPIVYVLYPKLSQEGIDNTIITVQGIGLAGPTPDTYLFSLNTTLLPQTSYSVNLEPFNVSFYLTDFDLETPFTVVEFPKIHVDHETTVNITNQVVQITNFTAWEKYLSVAFTNESYRVTTLGRTQLYLGGLPKNEVNYNKTVSIPGFGGLTDISVSNLTVLLGNVIYNFYATADVVNPSPSTVLIGNITYDTYIADNETFIGQTFLTDVALGPGANVFSFKSSTSELPVVEALTKRPACQDGVVDFKIVPVNITFNDTFVPWLLPSLTNVTQALPIAQAIEKVTNNTFKYSCAS